MSQGINYFRYGWKNLPWKRFQRTVFKLQKRIYKAASRGDVKLVRKLQRLLRSSIAAKFLAVRRVTQDNRGKKTAGVDGIKSLNNQERLELTEKLSLTIKPQPLRRVWIPKPGKQEKRPLGIPVMQDRAAQALAKLVLEPEWEAYFEPNSYGFRPGRCTHDAIEAIFKGIYKKTKYVIDADIAKCFDRIDHRKLLIKLNVSGQMRRAIRGWLKAGILDGKKLFPSETGTPQGGVISPLLANIALHGLERAISKRWPAYMRPKIVRYADDFVIIHVSLEVIIECQKMVNEWLAEIGLQIHPEKTRIVHTLNEYDGQPVGFDFLGVHIRQYRMGKRHDKNKWGHKTIIKPSKKSQKKYTYSLKMEIRKLRGMSQEVLIYRLNPKIRGWCNYFKPFVSKRIFNRMDQQMYKRLANWARRRHANKGPGWIATKYWRLEKGQWMFGVKDGPALLKHIATPIRRFIKVKDIKSPFDGDWFYWAKRMGKDPRLPKKVAQLLKKQKGKCTWCNHYFLAGDIIEKDHILAKVLGGTNKLNNYQLLHGHCHDSKTALDLELLRYS